MWLVVPEAGVTLLAMGAERGVSPCAPGPAAARSGVGWW